MKQEAAAHGLQRHTYQRRGDAGITNNKVAVGVPDDTHKWIHGEPLVLL